MTSLLLDTCALIWLGNGDASLSLDARQAIEECETVYVSPISLWEVSAKCRKGKLQLKLPPREWFNRILQRYQLKMLPLTNEVMFRAGELHEYHKDPSYLMIIASAMVDGLTIVTADRNFPLYGVQTIC